MTGGGIFAAKSENGGSEASNPADKTSVRMYQQTVTGISQISFSADGSVSPKKPSSLPEVAKQRELSGTLESDADAKINKQLSEAKSKELTGSDIFGSPPEMHARPLAVRNIELQGNLDFVLPQPRSIHTSVKVSNAADKYSIKPPIFSGLDYPFWKSRMKSYIIAQGFLIWQKVKLPYEVPADENVTAANFADVEANAKARNILIQGLSRSEYYRISHLRSAHQIWVTLDAYHEGTTQLKTARQDQYKRDYNKFEQHAGETLDECFGRFTKILSDLRSVGSTYSDSENARHFLTALDLRVWEMIVTIIKDTADLSTLTLESVYSRLKTYEIDVVFRKTKSQSMALITDPTRSIFDSSSGFSLSTLCKLSDEQLEKFPENELALLARKFTHAYKRVRQRKRGGTIIFFECGGPNHIRANCPKLEKSKNELVGSSKNDYIDKNHSKKPPTRELACEKKYRNFSKSKKLFHRVLTALDDIDLSDMETWSDEGEDDPREKTKGGDDFTGMCFMADANGISDDDLYRDSNEPAGGPRNISLSEDPVVKTAKKIHNQKFQELTGNNIFKEDAPLASGEKSLSSAKLKEISGNDLFANGKAASRDYLGGVRKPPGGESSIALI